jgi:hypothetical protein
LAALKVISSWRMKSFNAVRRVSRMRCVEDGPTGRWYFTAVRRFGSLLARDPRASQHLRVGDPDLLSVVDCPVRRDYGAGA